MPNLMKKCLENWIMKLKIRKFNRMNIYELFFLWFFLYISFNNDNLQEMSDDLISLKKEGADPNNRDETEPKSPEDKNHHGDSEAISSDDIKRLEKEKAESQSPCENLKIISEENMDEMDHDAVQSSELTLEPSAVESSSDTKDMLKGWETPPQDAMHGVVQPRVIPPIGKPTRWTNQLDFLMKDVLKQAKTHKHSWPFLKPVDAIKLNIPDYHKVIKRPMDLGTIEKRLKNMYYYSAKECMKDIMAIFNNCYIYNPPEYGVYKMAKELEQNILLRISKIPSNELEIPFPSQKKGGKNAVGAGKKIIRATSTTTTTKASRESSAQRGLPDSSSSIGVVKLESDSTDDHKVKGVKRKADTTTSFDEDQGPSTKQAPKRENRIIKKGPPPIDYSQLKPRLKGKLNDQMKFCTKLINELITSKKCQTFTWPFLEPVDVENLNLYDYYDIVKEPMDLGTIKRKMEARQYTNPEEIRTDILLMCNNSFLYNPADQVVHKMGKQLQDYFNNRWKQLPPKTVEAESPPTNAISSILPVEKEEKKKESTSKRTNFASAGGTSSSSSRALDDDDQIDLLLFNINEKLTELQQYNQELISLRVKRKEAQKLQKQPPILSAELHSAIKRAIENTSLPPNAPTLGQLQNPAASGLLPSMFPNMMNNAAAALQIQQMLQSNMPLIIPQQNVPQTAPARKKTGPGRPKGSATTTLPHQQSVDGSASALVSPNATMTSPEMGDNSQQMLAAENSQPPLSNAQHQQLQPVSSGGKRGRKPGSKNKPKTENVSKDSSKWEYEFNSEDEHSLEPMSYEEKARLSQEIGMLAADKIHTIVSIIAAREKMTDFNPEELEIDFETLKPITLRELEAYVKMCQSQQQQEQTQQSKVTKKTNGAKSTTNVKKKEVNQLASQQNMNGGASTSGKLTNGGVQAPSPSLAKPPLVSNVNRPAPLDTSKEESSSDSSSGSSSSESDSSDSSDSESEEKPTPRKPEQAIHIDSNKVYPTQQSRNNEQAPINNMPFSMPNAVKTQEQIQSSSQKDGNNEPIKSASTNVTSNVPTPTTSIVHSGAAPLLQSNNAVEMNVGIAGTVLDALLPPAANDDKGTGTGIMNKTSWSSLTQKVGETGQLNSANAATAFEQFRKTAREKEERKRMLKEDEDRRRRQRDLEQQLQQAGTSSDSTQHSAQPLKAKQQVDQEEIKRLREMEKERRKREDKDHVDMASQMELMADFEMRF